MARGIVLLLNIVIPLTYGWWFQVRFGYPQETLILHSAVVVGSLALILLLHRVLRGILFPERARVLTALLLTLHLATIGLVDLSSLVSNTAWSDNMSLALLFGYLRHWDVVAALIPATPALSAALLLSALAGLAALTVLAFLAYYRILSFSDAPLSSDRLETIIVGAVAVGAFSLVIIRAVVTPWVFVGEPILNFFHFPRYTYLLRADPVRQQAALEDQATRLAYPRDVSLPSTNVILFLVDSLRADRMSVYGYERPTTPFLDQLQQQGRLHRVEMALSACSESLCGIGATLASRPLHQQSPRSFQVTELLRMVGYRVVFLLSGNHAVWPQLQEFYSHHFDHYRDVHDHPSYASTDDAGILELTEDLPTFDGTPTFFYYFLMSSHVASVKHPEFLHYRPHRAAGVRTFWNELLGTQRKGGELSKADLESFPRREVLSNRYDNGVLQTDAFIQKIVTTLEKKGYLQDSVIVITGDHGDGLGEHGHLGHSRYLYQEDIRIPLLVIDKEAQLYRNREFASQLDIAPTIVDRLGLPIPRSWAGHSLLQPLQRHQSFHQTRRGESICRAIVRLDQNIFWKYLRCGSERSGFQEELYNLSSDPGEKHPIRNPESIPLFHSLRNELARAFQVTLNSCDDNHCVD